MVINIYKYKPLKNMMYFFLIIYLTVLGLSSCTQRPPCVVQGLPWGRTDPLGVRWLQSAWAW